MLPMVLSSGGVWSTRYTARRWPRTSHFCFDALVQELILSVSLFFVLFGGLLKLWYCCRVLQLIHSLTILSRWQMQIVQSLYASSDKVLKQKLLILLALKCVCGEEELTLSQKCSIYSTANCCSLSPKLQRTHRNFARLCLDFTAEL